MVSTRRRGAIEEHPPVEAAAPEETAAVEAPAPAEASTPVKVASQPASASKKIRASSEKKAAPNTTPKPRARVKQPAFDEVIEEEVEVELEEAVEELAAETASVAAKATVTVTVTDEAEAEHAHASSETGESDLEDSDSDDDVFAGGNVMAKLASSIRSALMSKSSSDKQTGKKAKASREVAVDEADGSDEENDEMEKRTSWRPKAAIPKLPANIRAAHRTAPLKGEKEKGLVKQGENEEGLVKQAVTIAPSSVSVDFCSQMMLGEMGLDQELALE
eukprot:gene6878-30854_t